MPNFDAFQLSTMSLEPKRAPPAVQDLNQENVNTDPWTHKKTRVDQFGHVRVLGKITVQQAERHLDLMKERFQNYHKLKKCEFEDGIVTLFAGEKLEKLEKNTVFEQMKFAVESSGILKKLGVPIEAASGMIEVLQVGDILGNVLLIQVLEDCREGHGCQCQPKCGLIRGPRRKGKPGKLILDPSCKTDFGVHKGHVHAEAMKPHGIDTLPKELVRWLADPSIFVVQSQVTSVGRSYGDRERIEKTFKIEVTSVVDSQNIIAAIYPDHPLRCHVCNLDFQDDNECRFHVIASHGSQFEARRSGNKRIFALHGLRDPSEELPKHIPVYNAPRENKFRDWPIALQKYDAGDIIIHAVLLTQVGLDIAVVNIGLFYKSKRAYITFYRI